jgi:hypothetical protein
LVALSAQNGKVLWDVKVAENSDGYFIASSLPPGSDYEISVKKPGFSIYEAKSVILQVGQNISISAVLTIAQQAESVTVTAEVSMVEQTKSGVGQVIETSQIMNLPINGRRVDQFALLAPGTTTDGTNSAVEFDSANNPVSITGYNAGTGWDAVTGLGTPIVNQLIPSLIANDSPGQGIAAIQGSKNG